MCAYVRMCACVCVCVCACLSVCCVCVCWRVETKKKNCEELPYLTREEGTTSPISIMHLHVNLLMRHMVAGITVL